MTDPQPPADEYEPGEIYEDARGFRYLRVLTDSLPRLPVSGTPLPWLYLDRSGDAVGRLEGIPQRPLTKMVPEGAAEVRLAEVRQTITTFLKHYGHSELPVFRMAQDLAEGLRQVLDRDKSSDDEKGDAGYDRDFDGPVL
jgi:hypothetical protein